VRAFVLLLLLALAIPPGATGVSSGPHVTRDAMPVVIPGSALGDLAAPASYVERPPAPMQDEQQDGLWLPLPAAVNASGTPVNDIVAYRWDGAAFAPIVSQVDERFYRYLTNYASGFGVYSQSDLELTYAFDVEGTRRTADAPGSPGVAALADPARPTTPDPIAGLDTDDEVVVLWADLAGRAPAHAGLVEVPVTDPLSRETRYAYVGQGAAPAFAPLVRYQRDADADVFVQSNHGSYGGAPGGLCVDGDGVDAAVGALHACDHRRPKDSATVTAQSYRFHYAGRWKMDGIEVAEGAGWSDSLVDRWKGRAFQQREGNAADVGGFEDENDWTKSSVTLGERAGPIRVLRETWGADSGTDVTRLETFYPTFYTQTYHLRVHPIPPDGLYAFWDNKQGMVDTFYSPLRPEGVPIDGADDEAYGFNSEWQQDFLGKPYFTVDVPEPTLQPLAANEDWDEVAGPHGSLVTYIHADRPEAGVLMPYYRDDASFDDGTGHEAGSFGAHGIHFFGTVDTDNAFLPVPTDEYVAVVTQHVLPGRAGNVGDEAAALERAPLIVGAGA